MKPASAPQNSILKCLVLLGMWLGVSYVLELSTRRLGRAQRNPTNLGKVSELRGERVKLKHVGVKFISRDGL